MILAGIFFISMAGMAGAAPLQIDGLSEEDIATSLHSNDTVFTTSYMNQSIWYKHVLLPEEFYDDVKKWNLKSKDDGTKEIQIQYELDQSTGYSWADGYKFDAKITFNESGVEVFKTTDGVVNVTATAHYEHLILEYTKQENFDTSNGTETNVTFRTVDVFSGEEPEKVPMLGAAEYVGDDLYQQSVTFDNLHDEEQFKVLHVLYQDESTLHSEDMAGLNYTSCSVEYDTYTKPELEAAGIDSSYILSDLSGYKEACYNVTFPADSKKTVSVTFQQPDSGFSPANIQYYGYLVGSGAAYSVQSGTDWSNEGTFFNTTSSSGVLRIGATQGLSIVNDLGDGGVDASESRALVGDDGNNVKYKYAQEFCPAQNRTLVGIDSVDGGISHGSDYGINYDVYIDTGQVDSTWKEGTKVFSSGTINDLNSGFSFSSPYGVDTQCYEIEFITTNSDGDGTTDRFSSDVDGSPTTDKGRRSGSSSYYVQEYIDLTFSEYYSTANWTGNIQADGATEQAFDWSEFNQFSNAAGSDTWFNIDCLDATNSTTETETFGPITGTGPQNLSIPADMCTAENWRPWVNMSSSDGSTDEVDGFKVKTSTANAAPTIMNTSVRWVDGTKQSGLGFDDPDGPEISSISTPSSGVQTSTNHTSTVTGWTGTVFDWAAHVTDFAGAASATRMVNVSTTGTGYRQDDASANTSLQLWNLTRSIYNRGDRLNISLSIADNGTVITGGTASPQNVDSGVNTTATEEWIGDHVDETNFDFNSIESLVTLGQNYTGVRQLQLVNERSDISWTNLGTTPGVSTPSECSQTNNTAVDLGEGTSMNVTVGFDCKVGTPGTPTTTFVADSPSTDYRRVWFNITGITLHSNGTKSVRIRRSIPRTYLEHYDDRVSGSLESYVDGVSDNQTVTWNGSHVFLTVGTNFTANHSLAAGMHTMALTYYFPVDDGSSAGGLPSEETEENESNSSPVKIVQRDGQAMPNINKLAYTLRVGWETAHTGSYTITNQDDTPIEVTIRKAGERLSGSCEKIQLINGQGAAADSATYTVPAAADGGEYTGSLVLDSPVTAEETDFTCILNVSTTGHVTEVPVILQVRRTAWGETLALLKKPVFPVNTTIPTLTASSLEAGAAEPEELRVATTIRVIHTLIGAVTVLALLAWGIRRYPNDTR